MHTNIRTEATNDEAQHKTRNSTEVPVRDPMRLQEIASRCSEVYIRQITPATEEMRAEG